MLRMGQDAEGVRTGGASRDMDIGKDRVPGLQDPTAHLDMRASHRLLVFFVPK